MDHEGLYKVGERFDIGISVDDNGIPHLTWQSRPNGAWARGEDYAALEAELARMTKSRDDWRDLAQRNAQALPDFYLVKEPT